MSRFAVFILSIVVVFAAVGLALWHWIDAARPVAARSSCKCGAEPVSAQYVGNAVCIGCHEKLGERWKISYHAKAMDHANDKTVLANFYNSSAVHFNSSARFYRKGSEYWAQPDIPASSVQTAEGQGASRGAGQSGSPAPEYQVKYVLGFYPLQQYLVEFPNGAIQCLPYAWDVDRNRWYHLYAQEPIPEGDPLHWKQPVQNWNSVCADCHTTNLKRNYRLSDDSWHTTYTELNVGCEACHGPGGVHVEWAKKEKEKTVADEASALRKTASQGSSIQGSAPRGLFSFAHADGPTATDACSVCHARRREIYPGYVPGAKFCDFWFPELLDSEAFYADGQIREEDYEYTSFLQSKFYAHGGSCGDCHDRFIAKVSHLNSPEGSAPTVKAICGRCHELTKYDSPTHHFHDVGKNIAGTRCEDCHMPATTYMGIDVRRDHSICIPRPQLTIDLNIPNSCNRCHTDQTAQWSLKTCESWYGLRDYRDHFAYALAAGRKRDPNAQTGLIRVLEEASFAPVVRASAGRLLGRYSGQAVKSALIRQLSNPSELIRTTCVESLEGKFDFAEEQRQVLVPLLNDPVRSVRLQAVRVLAEGWRSNLPDVDAIVQKRYQTVRQEYVTSLNNQPEQAATHLNRGVLSQQENEPLEAARHYRNALKRDSRFLPALNNLGLLQYNLGNLLEAADLYRRITELYPDQIDGWRFLGMVEAQMGQNPNDPRASEKLASAAAAFQEAIALDPNQPRLYYNLGLIQNLLNRRSEAIESLEKAIRLDPGNSQFRAALESVR